MRTIAITILLAAVVVTLAASATWAGTLDGTVKVGGVIVNQDGDRSAVQETYDVYDGFSVTQIRLNGTLDPRNYVSLDLRDINLDSRQGDFLFRRPGAFKLTAAYDQNRQVFDPSRVTNSDRKDWRVGAQITPSRWVSLSGSFNYLTREGDRLPFPVGSSSVLGSGYDNALQTGQVTLEGHRNRRGGALSYRFSDFSDDLNATADRTGQVVSARLYAPDPFYDKWTHLVRGSYGVRKLSDGDLEYTLANLQYTGVVEPRERFQFRYNFDGSRIDDQATGLKTIRLQNNVDGTYHHPHGHLTAGYGYETNDDRTLTHYNSWRAGGSFRVERAAGGRPGLTAKADYARRVKRDEEQLTLLRDVESSRIRASLQLQPIDPVTAGGGYSKREREFPDINVKSEGEVWSAFARGELKRWGNVSADYSYATDTYTDLAAGFDASSHIVTARAEFQRIKNLTLAGGVTYLDIGKDLDIEKSMVFVEGAYKVLNDYHLEVRYNVYNYDDYILLDRYYTANVLRINLAYDLHL